MAFKATKTRLSNDTTTSS